MTVAVTYCYPTIGRPRYTPLAARFASTWRQYPPGRQPVSLFVVCNGPEPGPVDFKVFDGLNPHWSSRENSGWDCGAHQWAAENIPCDLLVCFGACVHFHRAGWLDAMVEAYVQNGPGLYGCAAYLSPNYHVRTTAYWMPPQLLQSYPDYIGSDRRSRYAFEHGDKSLTRHVIGLGFPTIMVTWKGVFPFDQWQDHAPGPMEILVRDQHVNMGGFMR